MASLHLLHPATFALDGGAMFGIIPKPLWEKKIKPDEYNRISMALRVMLVQTKNKNILIDTGIGQYHDEKFAEQFKTGFKFAVEEAVHSGSGSSGSAATRNARDRSSCFLLNDLR